MGEAGGIIDYRLYYGMLQTISRRDQFPEDFGFNMRNYMLTRLKEMNKMVIDAEEEIPEKYWIETNQFVKDDIDHFSKRVRMSLQDSHVNNATALKLFWKIRCRLDPSRGECKVSPDQMSKRDKQSEEKKREELRQARTQKKQAQKRIDKARIVREQEQLALEQEKAEKEKLAKAAQNPIASMISLPFQNNTNLNIGPNDSTQNILNIQPVWPFEINADWNFITRTIVPVVSNLLTSTPLGENIIPLLSVVAPVPVPTLTPVVITKSSWS